MPDKNVQFLKSVTGLYFYQSFKYLLNILSPNGEPDTEMQMSKECFFGGVGGRENKLFDL
jgi:hypothetical protein